MKVKIFASQSVGDLETNINNFLQDANSDLAQLVDIKYSSSENFSEALLIYYEKAAE